MLWYVIYVIYYYIKIITYVNDLQEYSLVNSISHSI